MIHPTALIDDSAEIGDNVRIGPYCVIGADVKIGAGCELKSHVVIGPHSELGEHNVVYPFACLGEAPQDKKFSNEQTRLKIGNHNTIREYVTMNRGTVDDRHITEVGNDNWIMAYVHIAHDCVVGDHTIMANGTTLAGHVHIGNHVILGGFTKIHQFCRVGDHAFTAMDTAMQKDVPPFVMAHGSPAKPRAINFEGLKRRGFSKERIRAIKNAYKTIYQSEMSLRESLDALADLADASEDMRLMVDFVKASKRSIIR
ncbi:acyl-[acyl-carrier-protein]--UDP-N-acetylglucosamine O-acyltransferase [Marinicella pacifica]|uniref:Acyl-[acyl-carrier-protein]--UDP-N-acetylglucosamine O-acyltransferase n=1 Tax=Marinicella pacifica TaxID=1171543 RepID=A0A917CDH3_9GAMM|nr:acyl-ACP--UDP-N-acetylglucosamine O-acyltransferase [Marinicella pacifica]GGF85228.1 acyl-[acyl-carrier-protein]--UDP-N-acetylglucosamine O-acyltransferase [Marinicella pacifica]